MTPETLHHVFQTDKCPYCFAVTVVILCGLVRFVEDVLLTADEMGMTNPDEYVYMLTLHNAVDVSRPWRREKFEQQLTARSITAVFKPLLLVR